jgi:hypothetical protein
MFSRRTALVGLGASPLLWPFLPVLESSAQDIPPPKRLVLLYTPDGTLNLDWEPTGSETDFTLSRIHEPLTPHQQDIVVLGGMRLNVGGAGQGHAYGMAGLWTGARTNDGTLFDGGNGEMTGWGSGPSVDQVVAGRVGDATLYRSLEFGVQTRDHNVLSRMCYAGNDQPIAPEDDPYAMFTRVFGDLSQDESELTRLRERRKSVIDLVRGELDGLKRRFSADDRQKLASHLESLRAIERRLDASLLACEPAATSGTLDPWDPDNFPAVGRLQMDLLVQALACDATRVASLQFSRAGSYVVHKWLGHTSAHHTMSHNNSSGGTGSDPRIEEIDVWYAGEVAYLLDLLASVPEGDGTLLDNTLVVWGREMARASGHAVHPTPLVLAGRCGGALRTGRYVDFGDAGHSRLLVSICRAFGLDDVDSFGNMNSEGALDGLFE